MFSDGPAVYEGFTPGMTVKDALDIYDIDLSSSGWSKEYMISRGWGKDTDPLVNMGYTFRNQSLKQTVSFISTKGIEGDGIISEVYFIEDSDNMPDLENKYISLKEILRAKHGDPSDESTDPAPVYTEWNIDNDLVITLKAENPVEGSFFIMMVYKDESLKKTAWLYYDVQIRKIKEEKKKSNKKKKNKK